MRLSLRSVGALTAAVVMFALAPENWAVRGAERVLAQENSNFNKPVVPAQNSQPKTQTGYDQDDEATAAAKERRSADVFRRIHEHPVSSDAGRNARIESALDETVNFAIEPQSLNEALDLLATRFQIPISIDKKAFNGMNIGATAAKLTNPGITLRDTLEAILSIPDVEASFEIRHGALVISTIDQINEHKEVVVYDCRDLALMGTLDHFKVEKQAAGAGASGGAFGGGGMFQTIPEAAQPAVAPVPGAAPAAVAPAPAVSAEAPSAESPRRMPLIQTIIAATTDSWDEGSTTITEFGGLLVVRQSPLVHDKIKRLLADIRRMRANGAFASFGKEYEAEAKRRSDQETKTSAHAAK
jgi:hypothetical protein